MIPFDFQLRTRIIFGPHELNSLGELARDVGRKEELVRQIPFQDLEMDDESSPMASTHKRGPRRVLIVSDPGIVAAGYTERAWQSLEKAGLRAELFDGACENPTTREVERGVELANQFQPDLLVGLGGGSSLDCAKGINFLYTNGGSMRDYWGKGKARRPMLPLIGIPTTAGTGSEAQSFALISDAKTKVKMACGDPKASCAIALLDPVLTVTQPPALTALTGIDALAHAVETYVTKPRNSISLAFSREAWRLLSSNYLRVLRQPDDLEARGAMQLGACLAGLAIENSMLGATHALANPLTSHYGIPHGQAVALLLPHVVRYNGEQFETWYHELAAELEGDWAPPPGVPGTDIIAKFVEQMARQAGLAMRLSELEVERDRLPQLASDAMKQWTGDFNPRTPSESDYVALYQRAF